MIVRFLRRVRDAVREDRILSYATLSLQAHHQGHPHLALAYARKMRREQAKRSPEQQSRLARVRRSLVLEQGSADL